MRKITIPLLSLILLLTISGCAGDTNSESHPSYEESKKMLVDVLKTDEGKKALQEVLSDDKMKQLLIMDQATVKSAIEETLTSDKGKEFWKKSFEDPKFAESFAKSMQDETEKLLKSLMKDPDYKGMMIETLKDPELTKEMNELLKSKEYREHLQKVITETLESPLYKAKIQDLLLKAAEDVKSGDDKKEDKGESGQ